MTLDQLVVWAAAAVVGREGKDRRGIARPMTRELLRGDLLPSLLIALSVGHGGDQVERRLDVDVVHQLDGVVFRVGGHQGFLGGQRGKNLRGHV